jgi:flagellar biosynthesis protein
MADEPQVTTEESEHPYRRIAAALVYDTEREPAPRVGASGRGRIADRIIALAHEHGIPIREDRVLAEALAQLDLGDLIPPKLYQAVAEVLAFVYRLDVLRAERLRGRF